MLEARQLLAAVGIFSSDLDIGSPALAGSANYSSGTYTVNGGGADIGGNSDQLNFANGAFVGDGSIVARVNSLTNTDTAAKAGIMFRHDTSATSAFAGIFLTPSSGITFVIRTADGGTAGSNTTFGPHIPEYVKLTRGGSSVSAYYSADGITWSQLGSSQTITLRACCWTHRSSGWYVGGDTKTLRVPR